MKAAGFGLAVYDAWRSAEFQKYVIVAWSGQLAGTPMAAYSQVCEYSAIGTIDRRGQITVAAKTGFPFA